MTRPMAVTAELSLRAPRWGAAVAALVVAIIVLLACYWPTVQSLVAAWDNDGTYQYAFLIFPLSVWAAFTLRQEVRANPPVPSVWGLAAVAALVLLWYVGHLLDVNLAQHFAVVALFPALVLACWGWRALWVLVFPLGYLVVFAVPWGDALVGPLQDITAHFAVRALELTGTPVLLNGREIITSSAVWMVADACSGVKFFIACMALGCLYAWLMYQRPFKRVIFVALSAVTPIVANGLRVYFTVLIGETWGMEYATGVDHMIFGWQFFGVVLLLLLLAGWFFRDPIPVRHDGLVHDGTPIRLRRAVWPVAIAVLVAGPALAADLASPAAPAAVRLVAPTLVGWVGPQATMDAWQPVFNGAAGQVRAAYQATAGGDVVDLFRAVYTGKPRRGHSMITYGNDLYDDTHMRALSQTRHAVALANGRSVRAGELRLAGAGGPRLVWYWYCVGQRCTGSPVLAKLLQAWAVLGGQTVQSSVWALSAPVANDAVDVARKDLQAFVRALPEPLTAPAPLQPPAVAAGSAP